MSLRSLLLILLALLALGGPVAAGVVEDAEEALQAVPTDNPAGQRSLDGGGDAASADGLSSDSGGSDATGGLGSQGGRAVTAAGAGGDGSVGKGGFPAAEPTPVPAEQEATRRRQARDRADTVMSLVGVLVLLAMVVAAGMYSKRSRRDD